LEPCSIKEVFVARLHTHLIDKLARNLSFLFSTRLSITNQFTAQTLRKEVYQQKKRGELTKSAADSFIWIALYEIIAQQMNQYLPAPYFPIFSSLYLPVMAYILSRDILKRGYPLSSFGLTLRNWKRSILETLLFTSPLFLIVVLLKKLLIATKSQYAGVALFRLGLEIPATSAYDQFLLVTAVVLYVLCCPVQEYIFRGIIQTLWQKFSLTRHRTFFAIVIASVFYLNVHFYWAFSPIVLIPSLIWGWLFARHRTIVGVGLGHALLGLWMFYIVGF
jgi:membrane protease YdiL (CAAX protease family)